MIKMSPPRFHSLYKISNNSEDCESAPSDFCVDALWLDSVRASALDDPVLLGRLLGNGGGDGFASASVCSSVSALSFAGTEGLLLGMEGAAGLFFVGGGRDDSLDSLANGEGTAGEVFIPDADGRRPGPGILAGGKDGESVMLPGVLGVADDSEVGLASLEDKGDGVTSVAARPFISPVLGEDTGES